jgi:hypothetical protein
VDTISNFTPIESTATAALSPLEQLRAKIHDAEKAFAKTLRTQFEAIHARVYELDDEICEARLNDEHMRKALSKARKGLGEVICILSDGTDD